MTEQKLDLKKIALIGRTFDEYYNMFRLSDIDKENTKLLDAASGVSSFCAEASALGFNVCGCDPVYNHSAETLLKKSNSDLTLVMSKMPLIANLYRWSRFENVKALKSNRETAIHRFAQDYAENRDRYLCRALPNTGFDDDEFDITLSSHFLFMYDEQFDYEFHKEAVYEMLRVSSKEVRIFPLVNLKGQKSPFVRKIVKDAFDKGYGISIDKVPYEFVKNGNEMLRIQK
jgi:hypothetical protein